MIISLKKNIYEFISIAASILIAIKKAITSDTTNESNDSLISDADYASMAKMDKCVYSPKYNPNNT